jgi:uncharacterized membrane protein
VNTAVAFPLIFFVGVVALVGVVFHFLPVLARPDIFFAVTVAPGFRTGGDARRILARYRAQGWAATLAGALLVMLALANHLQALIAAGPLLQIAGVFAAFVAARSRVLPHAATPSPLRAAELAPRRDCLPGGWLAQLGPFGTLTASVAVLALRWQEIPDRFPVHWNIDFQPDRWAARSFGSVFAQPLLGVVMCALMALTGVGVVRWSRRVDAQPARAAQETRFRRTFALTLVLLEVALAALFSWLSLAPLRGDALLTWHFFALLLLVFAVAAVAVVLLARRRMEAARVPTEEEQPGGGELTVGDRTPDACWKLGMFYVNRADPALFVEKRFGLGYTINFGNPWAWVAIAVLVALIAGSILLLR